jgi:stage IV sporulation protein FB
LQFQVFYIFITKLEHKHLKEKFKSMFLLQVPPPTRFDLRFSIAGFPVRVHPLFWLIAVLFGASSSSLLGLLTWVVAIFVSVLMHELGHAFSMRRFGQDSQIILHIGGGLTVPETVSWAGGYANVAISPNQQIFISLAGPFTGFLFAAFIVAVSMALGGTVVPNFLFGFIPLPMIYFPAGWELVSSFFMSLIWVNIFWGFINLMPVHPLDGGNVTRYIFIQTDPLNGLRTSLWVSVITGALVAVVGLIFLHSTYMAIVFGLLAFQSFQALQGGGRGYF